MKVPSAPIYSPGQACSDVKLDRVLLGRAAARRRCAGSPAPSRRSRSAASPSFERRRLPSLAFSVSEQLLLVGRHDAVRRQALDRERPGDAHRGLVLIRPVVEHLDIGGLARWRRRSPSAGRCAFSHQSAWAFLAAVRPGLVRLARDFPFLPRLAERRVQLLRAAARASPGTPPR